MKVPPRSSSGAVFVIHPHVRQVRVGADAGEELCAMYELEGDDAVWIQVTSDQINLAYPFFDDPTARLVATDVSGHELLALSTWEPGVFATFDYDPNASSLAIAGIVDELLIRVLGVDEAGYPLTASLFPVASNGREEEPS